MLPGLVLTGLTAPVAGLVLLSLGGAACGPSPALVHEPEPAAPAELTDADDAGPSNTPGVRGSGLGVERRRQQPYP